MHGHPISRNRNPTELMSLLFKEPMGGEGGMEHAIDSAEMGVGIEPLGV